MLPRQLGIAFRHLDVRVAEDFGERSPLFIMRQDANV